MRPDIEAIRKRDGCPDVFDLCDYIQELEGQRALAQLETRGADKREDKAVAIATAALESALATMATRAVHAEARATVAEAEVKVLKRETQEERDKISGLEWSSQRLWAALWRSHGVSKETLRRSAQEQLGMSKEAAANLVDNGTGYHTTPDREFIADFNWAIRCESPVPHQALAPTGAHK